MSRSSSIQPQKKVLSAADKFSALFDNNWKSLRSTVRPCGRTVCSSGATETPQETNEVHRFVSCPITSIGKVVVPLEDGQGLEVFNMAPNAYAASNRSMSHALTNEQQIVGMSSDINGEIPLIDKSKSLNKAIIVARSAGFSNMVTVTPTFVLADVPVGLTQGGQHCDQKLLSPAQRLEVCLVDG